ncbi:hypothetical protein RHAL1_01634 [Beijerinckiaceae bacterium RH AL1]|nr:DUF1214 domain-containing protein [Beijerinckiaceae bacterium]VVB45176.1 hypothetical protein RHCH11_RHCH11_01597 [Beijerinckiaceae bacterium RH CH11]VVB45254.1 hypothetical protein RHAL8_01593 [Beijerinckiaceae bacterium RH AL8]VVC54734.1 hypothetical protein RHAL1_01634 [Beijerinckiaceae bacterium RH AL1]
MLALVKIVAAVLAGVFLGLVVTIRSLDTGGRPVAAGPWEGAPRNGTFDVDPYTLAADERSGVLPLGVAEGLTFVARTDSDGRGLNAACDYAVRGPMPQARFWTLSLLDAAGFPVADPAERYGFTSAEILREQGAPVLITVSPEARSGNWLPTGHARSYVLMLRLYDSGLSTMGTVFEAAEMPSIARGRCS